MAHLEQQRDTLVQEVHHRIKNHLQGVAGLPRNRQAQSRDVAAVLQDAISQVCVIAEIYWPQSLREAGAISLCQLATAALQGAVRPVPLSCANDMGTDNPSWPRTKSCPSPLS